MIHVLSYRHIAFYVTLRNCLSVTTIRFSIPPTETQKINLCEISLTFLLTQILILCQKYMRVIVNSCLRDLFLASSSMNVMRSTNDSHSVLLLGSRSKDCRKRFFCVLKVKADSANVTHVDLNSGISILRGR
jgi:hypothetical protein